MSSSTKKKLGILVGGGPAPGINGVIASVTIEAENQGWEVIGFLDGFKHLVKGKTDKIVHLNRALVEPWFARGGSMLGTARTNPTETKSKIPDAPPSTEPMDNTLKVFEVLGIDYLVTIGGDDTAYSASKVYEAVNGRIRIAHVPKTIDNDLPLPGNTPTFGYETARHIGTFIVRSLYEDARTTGRWYIIISMGRAAGHLALGVGKAAAVELTIIPEEFGRRFKEKNLTMKEIADIIVGAIVKQKCLGRNYGVAVLAEGLIEAIGEIGLKAAMKEIGKELSQYGNIIRDEHDHLRLGELEFGRMVKDYLTHQLRQLGQEMTFIDKDLGYELRCADPIPFDAVYTRDLGFSAVQFLLGEDSSRFGAIINIEDGEMRPLRFEDLINPETKKMKNRAVTVEGEVYRCARRYMTRLEKSDFTNPTQLKKLAAVLGWENPEDFRTRFEPIVKEG